MSPRLRVRDAYCLLYERRDRRLLMPPRRHDFSPDAKELFFDRFFELAYMPIDAV